MASRDEIRHTRLPYWRHSARHTVTDMVARVHSHDDMPIAKKTGCCYDSDVPKSDDENSHTFTLTRAIGGNKAIKSAHASSRWQIGRLFHTGCGLNIYLTT